MRGIPDLWRRDRDFGSLVNFSGPFQQLFDRSFPVDIRDTGSEVVIEAELAGLNRDQIDVEVTPQGVNIAVKVESDVEEKKEQYYRRERVYGRTERFIEFPVDVKFDDGDASYKDGILRLVFPKKVLEHKSGKKLDIH